MIGKCCAICAHAVLDATSFQLTSGQRRLVLVVSEVFAGEYGAGRGGGMLWAALLPVLGVFWLILS